MKKSFTEEQSGRVSWAVAQVRPPNSVCCHDLTSLDAWRLSAAAHKPISDDQVSAFIGQR